MKTITRDKAGESKIWWHWQSLDKAGRGWKHGRAWLHWPGNSAGIEWSTGRRLGAFVQCCDPVVGDEALTLHLELPFLFAVWVMVQNVPILKRLPGVKWNRDKYGNGERMISLRFGDGAMWWRLWRDPNEGKGRDWRDSCFNPARRFLGHPKYSEGPRESYESVLTLPEGDYPVIIEMYTARWKRPRWPRVTSIRRATIKLFSPVPVPGKGENSWDMDDDAISEMTCPAADVGEALAKLRQSVERDRQRYGGEGWTPEG